MKKVLSIVLAALLICSLLPLTAMAEAPASVKVKIYNGAASDFTLTLNNGEETYLVAGEGNVDLIKWAELDAPTDKFVKFAYTAETGILKVTFKNLVTDQTEAGGYTCHGLWFQAGEYGVDIELNGANSLTHGKSAIMKFENSGDINITGEGSMDVNLVASAAGAIWCAGGGNLTIKNTTMKFSVNPGSDSALHHAIYMAKGSATIEGSKIESVSLGGRLVYLGTADAKTGRYTLTDDTTRTITIKNSEITAKAGKAVFSAATAPIIENSTLKLTMSGSSGPAFEPAPTFVGDYSAIAGLAKNADKLDKLKVYDAKKLSSYTYIYIVPGIVELLPTEAPTEPPVVTPTEPEATEPEATTPEATTPEATTPVATTPSATTPNATTPNEGNTATTPNASEPAGDEVEEEGGSAMTVILIVMIALVVVAGGAFGVMVYLKKKKA